MSDHLQLALRDRDYATVMEILPDLIESGEGAVFTVDSLAAAICESGEVYADCRHRENEDDVAAGLPLVRVTKDCEPAYHRHRAAAIIQAAKQPATDPPRPPQPTPEHGKRADPDSGSVEADPEARLAAALHTFVCDGVYCSCDGDTKALLAADPTIARHMALGAAVERLREHYERPSLSWHDDGVWVWSDGGIVGTGPTATAAIEEALRDD